MQRPCAMAAALQVLPRSLQDPLCLSMIAKSLPRCIGMALNNGMILAHMPNTRLQSTLPCVQAANGAASMGKFSGSHPSVLQVSSLVEGFRGHK